MVKRSFFRKQIGAFVARTMGTITGILTREKVVALTFDDGPHPEFTPQLLKILAKYQAQATFFMVGQSARLYPDVLKDVAQGGHAIGIHGWDHSSFLAISPWEQRKQIRSCAQVIAPYAHHIFRPPYGHQNLASHLNVWSLGYEIIGWDLDAADWLFHDSYSIVDTLTENLQPGSIVLLHDAIHLPEAGVNIDRQSTLDAVDLLLDRLSNDLKFVTVPGLFQYGIPRRVNWYRNGEEDKAHVPGISVV
jgi:peptidoglycan/xylan/chitin deacetylase (PgdA/CDA1 family)